jgi:IS30 family transposase
MTSRTHITPSQKAKIIALRQAGFSISSIAEQSGASISTIKRHVKGTAKGSAKKALVDAAAKDLLQALDDSYLRKQVAALVADDLAISSRIRTNIYRLLERIEESEPSDPAQLFQTMRALSAASTSLKLSSDTMRSSLSLPSRLGAVEENLPELVIRDLTGAEIEDICKRTEALSAGTDDGLGGILHPDDEIVTEGFEDDPDETKAA